MIRLMRRLAARFRREEGTATVEFVLAIPVLMTIFMASFESGMFMVRHVMLEQALDHVMRDLRLGVMGASITHDQLRDAVCDRTVIIKDCRNSLKVELQPISTETFRMPAIPTGCIDRSAAINPSTTPVAGGSNEPMIVRVCVLQKPMFPMTGVGLRLRQNAVTGEYGLVAMSVFANEPR